MRSSIDPHPHPRSRKGLFLRFATRLRDVYDQRARVLPTRQATTFQSQLQSLLASIARTDRLLTLAVERSWNAAARNLRRDQQMNLSELAARIDSQRRMFDQAPEAIPPLPDLYEELCALENEFEVVEFRRQPDRIAVVTDSIVLEGVALGPFRIELCIRDLLDEHILRAFRVEAMDPNPAAADEHIHHPHLNDDTLCCGDGESPIWQALTHGRISGFFILVQSILRTYNAESAYVDLDRWSGQACSECGYVACEDDMASCSSCAEMTCGECTRECIECHEIYCRMCMKFIEPARTWVCRDCAVYCSDCGCVASARDLVDDLCPRCRTPGIGPAPAPGSCSEHEELLLKEIES